MEDDYQNRLVIVQAFEHMVAARIAEGWIAYYVNFMFYQLPEKKVIKFAIMADHVTRVYQTLLTCVVRRPTSKRWSRWNPILIGCPDNQVAKRNHKADIAHVNDGWHFNAVILLPPDGHSRFREHLQNHFVANRDRYCRRGDALERIHVTPVTYDTMVDYALKQFKRAAPI